MKIGETYFYNLTNFGVGAIVFSTSLIMEGVVSYMPIIWAGEKEPSHEMIFDVQSNMGRNSELFSVECHRELIMTILSSNQSITVDWDLYNTLCK